MSLRKFFDRIEPDFLPGGKWERYFPIYEMVESFIYTPKTVTKVAPHARSYIDMKRIMTYVVLATVPCILFPRGSRPLPVSFQLDFYLPNSGLWGASISLSTHGPSVPASVCAGIIPGSSPRLIHLPIACSAILESATM